MRNTLISPIQSDSTRRTLGLVLGFIGVLGFSFALPATKLAVPYFGSTYVGIGRIIVGAILAGITMAVLRERPPDRKHWGTIARVALGAVVTFPILTSIALQTVPASHGAVVIGILPALTAFLAVIRANERQSLIFWIACLSGALAVVIFAITTGASGPEPADALLAISAFAAALSYAEGGRLSREIGGWRVISWAVLFAAPFAAFVLIVLREPFNVNAPPLAWFGLIYVGAISMYGAFFVWYAALAMGGIGRVGQIQIAQPVLTLGWSALVLGEAITPATGIAAIVVVACAAVAVRTSR